MRATGELKRRTVLKAGVVLAGMSFAPKALRAADRYDVIVLGAGFSGLNAALILAEQGAKVCVLEASQRVGGRAFTADHFHGTPEFGASQIGTTYARVRDMAHQLGIELAQGANINAPFTFSIGGELIKKEDWEGHHLNETVGEERAVLPSALRGFYTGKYNPFRELDDWLEPDAARYDVPLGRWLLEKGISEQGLSLVNDGLIAPDIWNVSLLPILMDATSSARAAEDSSQVANVTTEDRFQAFSRVTSRVVGGTSRLTEAMAERLGDAVQLNKVAVSIDMSGGGAEVTCMDGTRWKADYLISTIPFSVFRRVEISPPLPEVQAAAVREMPYRNNTQVHIQLSGTPFWEQDDMDASLWTDGPINVVRQPLWHDGSRDRLVALCTGNKANRLDQLSEQERGEFVTREIEKLRPSTKGKMRVIGVHSWSKFTWSGGCGHTFSPGQVTRFAREMIKPHLRMHFAGEHTRRLEVGMESAMASGERAALEVLERIST